MAQNSGLESVIVVILCFTIVLTLFVKHVSDKYAAFQILFFLVFIMFFIFVKAKQVFVKGPRTGRPTEAVTPTMVANVKPG